MDIQYFKDGFRALYEQFRKLCWAIQNRRQSMFSLTVVLLQHSRQCLTVCGSFYIRPDHIVWLGASALCLRVVIKWLPLVSVSEQFLAGQCYNNDDDIKNFIYIFILYFSDCNDTERLVLYIQFCKIFQKFGFCQK